MKNTKHNWFLPLRYHTPADLEAHYEKMESEGWHIQKITQASWLRTTFVRSEPIKYHYVVDLHVKLKTKDYISHYSSLGWEYVGRISHMFIWRMSYKDERPESFTHTTTAHERSSNINLIVLALLLFLVAAFIALTTIFIVYKGWENSDSIFDYSISSSIIVLFTILLSLLLHKSKKGQSN